MTSTTAPPPPPAPPPHKRQRRPRSPDSVFLNVDEFCKAYDVSRSKFYRLVQEGRGPRITKVGDATRIHREDAADWLEQIRGAPADRSPRGGFRPKRQAVTTETAAEIGARAARNALRATAGKSA